MSVFISHAFGEDSYCFKIVRKYLQTAGVPAWDTDGFTDELSPVKASSGDYFELKDSFTRAGYRVPSEFEAADGRMRSLLARHIGDSAPVVVLWSRHHAFKYWTTFERKTAASMGKPVVLLLVDDTPIPPDLSCAAANSSIPTLPLREYLAHPDSLLPCLSEAAGRVNERPVTPTVEYDQDLQLKFVLIEHPFVGVLELSECPLTNRQVELVWPQHSVRRDAYSNEDDQPAVYVTWQEAKNLCSLLTKRSRDYQYRLPGEMEWEFAARAGDTTPHGQPELRIGPRGRHTAPVGTVSVNAWGFKDCTGNVAQWTSEEARWQEYNGWYRPAEPVEIDGSHSDFHIVKGGYFETRVDESLSLSYSFAEPSLLSSYAVGLRIARDRKTRHKHLARGTQT